MSRKLDATSYIGKCFYDLTIIGMSNKKSIRTYVRCKCVCGNEVDAMLSHVINGNNKSCGCRQKRTLVERNTKHGHSDERLYLVWGGMKRRCRCKSGPDYRDYASRGIEVCSEWLDYNNFRKWAYENGYDENSRFGECTIDRIDVNKGYEPCNCRWVPVTVQARNKRTNFNTEYNGETHCLVDWERITGIKRETIKRRYLAGLRGEALFSKTNILTGKQITERKVE